jgi:D-proline reductase (dithiol) PrdB
VPDALSGHPAYPIAVEPYEVHDVEEQWAGWTARCSVSHHEFFVAARNRAVAFCRPRSPLSALRVALISSGGVYCADDLPFDMTSHAGDDSFRWIPAATESQRLRFAHDHYDHTDADQDPNCVLPIDRLRELAADGVIREPAPRHIGLMGFIPDPARLMRDRIPQIVSGLWQDRVDAAVMSPG